MSTGFRSSFLQTLDERGFLYQCTDLDALDTLFLQDRVVAYIGFDCTAESLHVGHLLSIMALRHLQRCGHVPVALLGGGTTLVGDPSGKSEARKMLTPETIADYLQSIGASLSHFLDFSAGAICVNNADWLTTFNYIDFLRDYGVHFSVNRMLSFDSVKSRLDSSSSLSFLEFNYMLLQAVDFVELHRSHDVRLQMGGADQWGNIINGIDLARRLHMPPLYGLTFPLLTTASGAKMGKTADGAVWLKSTLCKPFDYWQYFRNTHDADVGRFLRLFTELPLDEIKRLERLSGQEINEAKKILATEATSLCHGRDMALDILKQAQTLFEEKDMDAAIPIVLDSSLFPLSILDLLMHAKLFPTRSAARRMLESGAVRLDGAPCLDYRKVLQPFDYLTISIGKGAYYRCSLRS